jgi:hypothetical protein
MSSDIRNSSKYFSLTSLPAEVSFTSSSYIIHRLVTIIVVIIFSQKKKKRIIVINSIWRKGEYCEMTPKPTHLNGSIQKQRIYIIIKLN